jgi:uncharacterized protein YgbK (DUF1537 family)
MIAVIADDITGGAEIAGIGLRYGLRVELSTRFDIPFPDVDLWVISTDSRSMSWENAFTTTVQTVRHLKAIGIEQIFKKTDSVLRGHVLAELVAQLKEEDKKKVVLCPANPESGRKIINGTYFIDGIPVHETSFSKDPDFPINSSNVKEIVGSEFLCELEISIEDAATEDDLQHALRFNNRHTVLAGSAAFFKAYLESLNLIELGVDHRIPELRNVLFVRGSTYSKSRFEVEAASLDGLEVIFLSPLIIGTADYTYKLKEYASKLMTLLNLKKKAVLAIGSPVLKGEAAGKIKEMVAEVVSMVMSTTIINELIIEGGATSSAIFRKLNFTRFIPTYEFAAGVVRLKVNDLKAIHVTIKPGSYQFPSQIWNFKNNK